MAAKGNIELQITTSNGNKVTLMVDRPTAEAVQQKDPDALMMIQRLVNESNTSSIVVEEPTLENHPPSTEELVNPSASSTENHDIASWTTASTKALLHTYEENKDKTNKWKVIGNALKSMGYGSTSAEKCRLKVRSLEEKYRRQARHNSLSGNNGINIDSDLERIFGPDGNIKMEHIETPLQSAQGSKGIKRKVVSGEELEKTCSTKKKVTRRQSGGVSQVMKYMQETDERMEKQHGERNDLLKQLISALK